MGGFGVRVRRVYRLTVDAIFRMKAEVFWPGCSKASWYVVYGCRFRAWGLGLRASGQEFQGTGSELMSVERGSSFIHDCGGRGWRPGPDLKFQDF